MYEQGHYSMTGKEKQMLNSINPVPMIVTQEFAKNALKNNYANNRKVNRNQVEKLKDDIINGRWHTNNDMICINDKGEIINGQHRLTAVAECGIPCLMVVCYGFQSDAFNAMDSGLLTRSLRDQMKSISEDPMKRNSAIIAFIHNMFYAELKTIKIKMSVQKINELINSYYGICQLAYRLLNTSHKSAQKNNASLTTAYICAAVNGVSEETLLDLQRVIRCNNIDITKQYNYKIALDMDKIIETELRKKYVLSSLNSSSLTAPQVHSNMNCIYKKIIWCFANNKKRIPIEDPYPITEEKLKQFSDELEYAHAFGR